MRFREGTQRQKRLAREVGVPTGNSMKVSKNSIVVEKVATPPLVVGSILSEKLERRKTWKRERKFMKAIRDFWKDRFGREEVFPAYGYVLPLCELWKAVQQRDGFEAVCDSNLWKDIAKELDPGSNARQLSFVARTTYKESLLQLERVGGFEALGKYSMLSKSYCARMKGNGKRMQDAGQVVNVPNKKRKVFPQIGEVIVPFKMIATPLLIDLSSAIVPSAMCIREVDEPIRAWKSRAIVKNTKDEGVAPGSRGSLPFNITSAVKNLNVGDTVEARTVHNGSLGAWYSGSILAVAPGSGVEGGRRYKIRWFPCPQNSEPVEWVPLLSPVLVPGTNEKDESHMKPIVMVRIPDGSGKITRGLREAQVGEHVEASCNGGWVDAEVLEVRENSKSVILRKNDSSPSDWPSTWSSPMKLLRPVHSKKGIRYGMITLNTSGTDNLWSNQCKKPKKKAVHLHGVTTSFWSYPTLEQMQKDIPVYNS